MLKFFKGKDKGNLIYAPCKGRVVPLAEVPDPVFADKVLGDGFAGYMLRQTVRWQWYLIRFMQLR